MRGGVAKGVSVCVVPHPDPRTARVVDPIPRRGFGTLDRSFVRVSRFLTRPLPHAGAAAHGENKAKMCDELFKAYKACRKAENAEIVRRRRESRKGMFWD